MNRIYWLLASTVAILMLSSCSSETAPEDTVSTTAKGTITLKVSINGSRTRGVDMVETATVFATANYRYDLPSVPIEKSGDDRMINWDDQRLRGSASWTDERLRTYLCNGSEVTDRDLTTRSVTFGSNDDVVGGAIVVIKPNGSYQLGVSGIPMGTPGTQTLEQWTYCEGTTYTKTEGALPVPFLQYFIPFTGGLSGMFVGSVSSTDPNAIKGSFSGTDELVVFSEGMTNTTIPIEYTVTWDLTLEK